MPNPLQASLQTLLQQDDLIGGKYRIGSVIGSGGVATVYRATHVWTEREVAVKVLDPSVPHFDHLRSAFLREARATVQLSHPNVVDVLDMGDEDWATAYMVMELLEGPTLRDVLLERGSLTEIETLAILLPLIDALEKAHALGIVHRDFKPENVMLIQDSRGFVAPKLIDFGVAEVLQNVREESLRNEGSIIMGTPQYMSPEQAQDQRALIGPHTDVWGVGVVWYECLTGQTPFEGESSIEVLQAVCRAPIDFDPIPEGHAAILGDMLDRSTDRRIGSLTELKQRIENAGIELPSIPPPEQVTSSWLPAGPERTGVQPTLTGFGPRRLLATPSSPPEAQVDSELLNVPMQSQRKAALAGIALAIAVVLAAWWTVREPATESAPVIDTPSVVVESASSLELGQESSKPTESTADEAEPEALILSAEADAESAVEPESATDAELVTEPAPTVEAEPSTEPEPETAKAAPSKPAASTARRKPKPARSEPKPKPSVPDTPQEPDYAQPPDLVTEW